MAVTVLHRMSGVTTVFQTFSRMSPSGKWYEKAAAWAAARVISGGVGETDSNRYRHQRVKWRIAVSLWEHWAMSCRRAREELILYNDAAKIDGYAASAFRWASETES
jgi:hypothetical protein